MAGNDIAIQYTENTYSSRNEMSRDIGFQVSEMMWKKVTDYRSSFSKIVPLRWVNSTQPILCTYPGLSVKFRRLNERLNDLIDHFESVGYEQEYAGFAKCSLRKCIDALRTYEKIQISDEQLDKLFISENPYDEKEDLILNYAKAVSFIVENSNNDIDDAYLVSLYSTLVGGEILSSYERQNDITHINRMAVVGRVYDEVSTDSIKPMMNSLVDFLTNDDFNPFEKAFISLYYMLIVKPYKKYASEYAVLVFKSVLSHYGFTNVSAYLPIEQIIFNNFKEYSKANSEVQQFNDFTYFISKVINYFEPIIEDTIKTANEQKINEIKEDFFKADVAEEPKPIVEETPIIDTPNEVETIQAPVEPVEMFDEIQQLEEPKEEAEEVQEVAEDVKVEEVSVPCEEVIEEPVPEYVAPVIEEPKNDESSLEEPLKTEVKVEPIEEKEAENETPAVVAADETEEVQSEGIAITFKPVVLNEKQAQMLENQILGTDVFIKRKEAKFYARHCSLGVYYTIDQYKKATKCVYETARTSMEHLVELGYYNKKQVGKKFVYTPIERK